jgi:hypothetical protein
VLLTGGQLIIDHQHILGDPALGRMLRSYLP